VSRTHRLYAATGDSILLSYETFAMPLGAFFRPLRSRLCERYL